MSNIEINAPAGVKMIAEFLQESYQNGTLIAQNSDVITALDELSHLADVMVEWFRALQSNGINLPKNLTWTSFFNKNQ